MNKFASNATERSAALPSCRYYDRLGKSSDAKNDIESKQIEANHLREKGSKHKPLTKNLALVKILISKDHQISQKITIFVEGSPYSLKDHYIRWKNSSKIITIEIGLCT